MNKQSWVLRLPFVRCMAEVEEEEEAKEDVREKRRGTSDSLMAGSIFRKWVWKDGRM